jgi:hypothetical protein
MKNELRNLLTTSLLSLLPGFFRSVNCALAAFLVLSFAPSIAEAADTTIIKGADTAYYFDAGNKLLALQGLEGAGVQIEESKRFAKQDGMRLIFKSTCQNGLPALSADPDGKVDVAGKASTVVYAVSGPSYLIVLGVEDLRNVRSRIISPIPEMDPGGICCCKARPCNGGLCCGCATNCLQ